MQFDSINLSFLKAIPCFASKLMIIEKKPRMQKANSKLAFEMPKLQSKNATRNRGRPNAFGKPFPEFEVSKIEFGLCIIEGEKNVT